MWKEYKISTEEIFISVHGKHSVLSKFGRGTEEM